MRVESLEMSPYQYISNHLLDHKIYKLASSTDNVPPSLHPLLKGLSKQLYEIEEVEKLLENYQDSWQAIWDESGSGKECDFLVMQQNEDEELADQEAQFQARIEYTQFMFLRRGIQSEREEIKCDQEAWKLYQDQRRKEAEMLVIEHEPRECEGQDLLNRDASDSHECYDQRLAVLEEQRLRRLQGGPPLTNHNRFDSDFPDDYGEPSNGGEFDRAQWNGVRGADDEEEEEMVDSGNSACIVHGFSNHVTSECPEALKLLDSGYYYLEACDPRAAKDWEKVVNVPVFEREKLGNSEAMVTGRTKLYYYEENREVYNYL